MLMSLPSEAKFSPTRCRKLLEGESDPIARLVGAINRQFDSRMIGAIRGETGSLFRGFAKEGYGEPSLMKYFLGDRAQELRSWDYSRKYEGVDIRRIC